MKQRELIQRFLDGEVTDTESRRRLFEMAGSDPSLAAELGEHMLLRRMARDSAAATPIPPALAAGVLGTIAPSPATVGAAAGFGGLSWLIILLTTGGVVLTSFAIGWWLGDTRKEDMIAQGAARTERRMEPATPSVSTHGTSAVTVPTESQRTRESVRYVDRYRDRPVPDTRIPDGNPVGTAMPDKSMTYADITPSPMDAVGTPDVERYETASSLYEATTMTLEESARQRPGGWPDAVSLRTTVGAFGGTIQPLHAPDLAERIVLNAMWNITPSLSIGVDLGYESVLMSWESAQGSDRLRIDQQPNLLWGGVSVRYDATEYTMFDRFAPYAQVTVGGTRVGPAGRGALGLSVNVLQGIDIYGGADASAWLYSHDGTLRLTDRIGWTFGIRSRIWSL